MNFDILYHSKTIDKLTYIAPNAHYDYNVALDYGVTIQRILQTNNVIITLPFNCKVYSVNLETYNQQSSTNPNNIVTGGGYVTTLLTNTPYTVHCSTNNLQYLFKEI